MDLRRLQYFVTVARLGSFTQAARHLRISQPPLSQRIHELEAEMGTQLLDRAARPVALTPAGRLLFDQAVEILQRAEAMTESMHRLTHHERSSFRLGFVPANFHANLSGIIRRYGRAQPGVDIRIFELNSMEQADALREGRIDAGIGRIDVAADDIQRIVLYEEPLVVALPHDHVLALRDAPVHLAQIQQETFIVYTSERRPSLADLLLSEFARRHLPLRHVLEIGHYDSALILIAAGQGISIVPESAKLIASPGITYRSIAEPLNSPMVFCHRAGDTSPLLRAFYSVLADFLNASGYAVPDVLSHPPQPM